MREPALDPEVRRERGVYFTPDEVVGAQVRLVDDVLRTRVGCPDGFADPRVVLVDPACGAGAYPLAVLAHVGDTAGEVRERMRLFEVLPEAAALARAHGLNVVEADALANGLDTAADSVVVCLGNPPYRRRAARRDRSLASFTDGVEGVHVKNLYNEYVYFWRWALHVGFEARRGPAIVCFVTAASYLRGPAFGGLRRALANAVDELHIIDLEGDQRAARASMNVFPIRTPVAIALGVRQGTLSSPVAAKIRYVRLAGHTVDKLERLARVSRLADLDWTCVDDDVGARILPRRRTSYWDWPALTDIFPWQVSGAQLKRTWPIGLTPDQLRARWRRLLELPADVRSAAFGPTRDRDLTSSPPDMLDPTRRLPALIELTREAPCPEPVRYAYRAFDRRWVLADARLGDFPRPRLWRSGGPRQLFLTSMLTNVLGPGPAAVVTRHVPDLDHFRGSFGARGVVPLWLDAEATRPNVAARWLQHDPEELLAYCYAILSAPSYTRRFAEELRTPGPRIPMPCDDGVFRRGVHLGQELIAAHTYRCVAQSSATLLDPVGPGYPTDFGYDREVLHVGDGRFGPIAREVWEWGVSGYRVVPSWVRRRLRFAGKSPLDGIAPEAWSDDLTRELLELLWLVGATLARGPALDELLDEAATDPARTR